jgi:cytochrome c553
LTNLGVTVIVKKSLFSVGFAVATLTASVLSLAVNAADAEVEERERIMAEIQKDLANEDARQEAIRAGQERSILCSNCHGVDGNSVRPDIPNLAEQNPTYLIQQISKFADGRRKNFVMQTLSSSFTFQDKVNLAVFYTSQKLKPIDTNAELAARGERIYTTVCFRCHGEDGKGEEGYAHIAGQQIEFTKMTLKRFRTNALSTDNFDPAKRTDPNMEQVTARLSDEEIEGLAHYIAGLR